jgi:hypothetical protein
MVDGACFAINPETHEPMDERTRLERLGIIVSPEISKV